MASELFYSSEAPKEKVETPEVVKLTWCLADFLQMNKNTAYTKEQLIAINDSFTKCDFNRLIEKYSDITFDGTYYFYGNKRWICPN